MSTSLTSSSPTTYPQPNEDEIQHSPTKYTPYHTTTSIVGCRGGQNEDTHHSQTSFLPSIGHYTCNAIYDGHGGKTTSEWLEKHALPILHIHLESSVSKPDDTPGFIKAFREAQDSWQIQIPRRGGSTVTICLFVHLTNMTYNLTIGDGRWYYFHKTTSQILQVDKIIYDFSSDKTFHHQKSNAYNTIHQINHPITRIDGQPIPTSLINTLNPGDLEQYTCENENDLYEWKSWCTFHNILVFPSFSHNCYRMLDGPQCLRVIGDKNEMVQHKGVLEIFPINPLHTKAIVSCDGIDSQSASTPHTIGKLLHSQEWANLHFFDNHVAVTKLKLTGYPLPNTPLEDKISFLLSSKKFQKLDADWKAGVQQAYDVLKTKDYNISTFLAYYLSARMSDDNISITYFEFH